MSPYLKALTLLLLVPCSLLRGEVILFADDEQISQQESLKRVVLPAEKLPQPVIRGDKPWAQNPYAYGSFHFDDATKEYEGWYQSINSGVELRMVMLYSLSTNGRRWERPNLGLVRFQGNTHNNIQLAIGHLYSPSVVRLPDAVDGENPYRLAFWDIRNGSTYDGGGGMYTAISSDGIHWEQMSEEPRLIAKKESQSVSDVIDLMYDPAIEKFVVHAKCWKWDGEKALYRMICRSQSEDFSKWSTPEVVFDPRANDPTSAQTYGMPVFKYGGHYFGLLRVYHKPGNETIEVELAHSRDGKTWRRVAPGVSFVPVGAEGDWDDGMVFVAPPVIREDEMEFFYGGWDGPHNVGARRANIGLATVPLGRLVALTPESGSGKVLTQVIEGDPSQLTINVDASGGEVRVGVLDRLGEAVPGCSLEDSEVFQGDTTNYSPRWGNQSEPPALPARFQLLIELTGDARLFEVRY